MIEATNENGIHVLTISDGKANTIDVDLLNALSSAFANAHDARAVILRARGTIFSAGVDLLKLTEGGGDYAREFVPRLCKTLREVFEFPAPLVACVNGHAIAGGAILAWCADYRIMAAGYGRMGVPELLVGVPFPTVPLEIVRFAVPRQHIQSLVLTGRTVVPEEALRMGLVDEVLEPGRVDARAREIAATFAGIDARNFRMTKRTLRADAIARMEAGPVLDAQTAEQWASADTLERVASYLKRVTRK